MNKMNKKGDISISMVIYSVVGVLVLVAIVFLWLNGGTDSFVKLISFGGGKVNVDTVAQSCAIDCGAGNQFGFCTKKRAVTFKFFLRFSLNLLDLITSKSL